MSILYGSEDRVFRLETVDELSEQLSSIPGM
jgi:hypothetical protein